MIESIIYFSPLVILLYGIISFLFWQKKDSAPHQVFRLAKILLIMSFCISVVFFNKPLLPKITIGNHFTLFNTCLMYIGVFLLLFFSRKWFMSMKISADKFCTYLFVSILSGSLLITSVHMLLTCFCLAVLMVNALFLLKNSLGNKNQIGEKIYLLLVIITGVLLLLALLNLYHIDNSLFYNSLRANISLYKEKGITFISLSFIIITFMVLLGIAPLHFWFTELQSSTTLPVFSYFLLIPPTFCFAGLVHLNIYVLVPLLDKFSFFYISIALISIGIGAIGTCSGQNIRKMIAYSAVFHLGAILLILQRFSLSSTVASFSYLITYLLALSGICAALFGLKVKGDYLFMLHEFDGAATRRPYISAMLAVFLFSLLGFPPLLGFVSSFSLFKDLLMHNHPYYMIYLLAMMLLTAYAYISLIRAVYFEESKEPFDRADRDIYIMIFFNISAMLFFVLKPYFVTEELSKMLGDLFL